MRRTRSAEVEGEVLNTYLSENNVFYTKLR